MPSEVPRMPHQTHKSMLNRGSSKGLGLQAGEVAWYPKRRSTPADTMARRYVTGVGTALLLAAVLVVYIGMRSALDTQYLEALR